MARCIHHPREALSRCERDHHGRLLSALATIREMICSSIDVLHPVCRRSCAMAPGRITHITEVMGMEC